MWCQTIDESKVTTDKGNHEVTQFPLETVNASHFWVNLVKRLQQSPVSSVRLGPVYNIQSLDKTLREATKIGDRLFPAECLFHTPQYHSSPSSLLLHSDAYGQWVCAQGQKVGTTGWRKPQSVSSGGNRLINPVPHFVKGVAAPLDLLCSVYSF